MKRVFLSILFALGCLGALPVYGQTFDVVEFLSSTHTGNVGDTPTTTLEIHIPATPGDVLYFSRHAIDYDTTKVTLTNIVNGDDVPSYAQAPFVNWNGSGDAEVIWLGLFYDASGDDEVYWSGEAFDLTWSLDAQATGTDVDWVELGNQTNYVDLNPGVPCYTDCDTLKRYTIACDGSNQYQQCCDNIVPENGQCISDDGIFSGMTFYINPGGGGGGGHGELSKARAAFNARQEQRLQSMPQELQAYVRSLLAGNDPDGFDKALISTQLRTWSDVKRNFR